MNPSTTVSWLLLVLLYWASETIRLTHAQAGTVLYLDLKTTTVANSSNATFNPLPKYSGTFPGFDTSYPFTNVQPTMRLRMTFQYFNSNFNVLNQTVLNVTVTKTFGELDTTSYATVNDMIDRAGVSGYSMVFGLMITFNFNQDGGINLVQAILVTDGVNTYFIANYPIVTVTAGAYLINGDTNTRIAFLANTTHLWVVRVSNTPAVIGQVDSSLYATTTTTTISTTTISTTTISTATTARPNSSPRSRLVEKSSVWTYSYLLLVIFKLLVV